MINDAQKWMVLAGLLLFGWLLYRLAPVLTPFLISAILAFLGDPAVDRLETIRFSRTLAVVFVFFLMLVIGMSVLVIILPLLQDQIARLILRIPEMFSYIQAEYLPGVASFLGIDMVSLDLDAIKQAVVNHWQSIGNVLGKFLGQISQSGQVFLLWFGYLVIIPVVTFYLLRDWDILVEQTAKLIPQRFQAVSRKLARECNAVLAEFFRGQLLVMSGQVVIYSIGLWIVGLEFALLIGLLAGLVSFVPYLGFIVGISVAGVAAFFQFHDFIHIVYILVVFGVGQAIEGMLLSPLLIGDRIGLHPVAIIFAVMAGGQLFGFFGVLLALPVAAMVMVMLRFVHDQYLESKLYTQ